MTYLECKLLALNWKKEAKLVNSSYDLLKSLLYLLTKCVYQQQSLLPNFQV